MTRGFCRSFVGEGDTVIRSLGAIFLNGAIAADRSPAGLMPHVVTKALRTNQYRGSAELQSPEADIGPRV
jgi:hypothetical protein